MTAFRDASGAIHQVDVNVKMYQEAHKAFMTLPQYLNAKYPTDPAKCGGSTFQQMMASEGIFLKANRDLGIRPTTMADILNGPEINAGGVTVKDGVPASRILFPAVILQAVEDKLVANMSATPQAFEELIAVDESINLDRYEQPVLNFSKPEAGRHQGITQLAEPAAMLTITSSDKSYRIPTFALGLEISDQALRSTTIDIVALSLARQAMVEANERAQGYVLALLNGDVDNNDGSLSSLGLTVNHTTYDSASTGSSAITHKAWIKYLMDKGTKRTISHVVTDFDTAYRIENRTGKPVITNDDSKTSRIDTQFDIMNPTWAKNPRFFLTEDANWPAATMMGLDKRFAVRRVRNLSASYQAIESYVMRRSQAMRFDFAEHVNRLFNEAYGVLTIT